MRVEEGKVCASRKEDDGAGVLLVGHTMQCRVA